MEKYRTTSYLVHFYPKLCSLWTQQNHCCSPRMCYRSICSLKNLLPNPFVLSSTAIVVVLISSERLINQMVFTSLSTLFLGFTNTGLGFCCVLPIDTPTNNPVDLVRFESVAPILRILHFITRPRKTAAIYKVCSYAMPANLKGCVRRK